jgi:hypothetical protein
MLQREVFGAALVQPHDGFDGYPLENQLLSGVFRKLPQPSVSPAAPHPGQALLGAAEKKYELSLFLILLYVIIYL